ncbi:MAG: N-6 DNA methylase [Candidatus Desulforudaceae bacterium]
MARGLKSEEDVKIKFLLPLLRKHGYNEDCIDFELAIEVQEGRKKKTIYADAVVYSSPQRQAPLLLCETKSVNEPLGRNVREQAISYARLLPQIAPLVLITNGSQVQVFHSITKTRIPELPSRSGLDNDILQFVIDRHMVESLRREAKHELFIIDDVRTFKNILRACHNEIRNNEGLDPTAAFDEMSKVMFCKLYEEKENPQGNRFRLSVFDDSLERLGVNIVSKILDDAKMVPGYSDIFDRNTRINLKDRTIRKIVSLFEHFDLGLTAFDVKGEAFEFFLGETFTGGLGEYFTPRNIVEFMVEAIDPKIGDKVIDPFCGTGGFLIFAFEIVSEKIRLQEFAEEEKKRWRHELSNRSLFGTDWKERTSQACKMNMMVHGDGSSGIYKHDGLSNIPGRIGEGQFDICITNPPFGSIETDPEVLNNYELGASRKSLDRVILALERCLRLVRPGGLVAIIVIDGVLNNPSTQYVREYVKRHAWVRAVISLNKETFEGYGSRAKTSILFLEKKDVPDEGLQQPTFIAIARNTGLAPNGDEISGNVLPDILMDYREYRRSGTLLGKHSDLWVCTLGDRLDAEFYDQRTTLAEVDVSKLSQEIHCRLKATEKTVSVLTGSKNLLTSLDMNPERIGDLLEEVKVRVKIQPEVLYTLVGVRWWGEGAFVREEKLGKEIKASALFRVSSGWVIYNRLFACRGSFAILGSEHEGCYVSGEFPTFKVRDSIEEPELVSRYIVHCLNSPQYLAIVNAQSTGSTKTSRNRFNQSQFLNLKVYVPSIMANLQEVVVILDQVAEFRNEQARIMELAKSLRTGVLGMLPTPEEDT